MNYIEELEAMRRRILQEINTEIDILIERAKTEGNCRDTVAVKPYEIRYPLTAGGNIFKGKKPAFVIFGGEEPVSVTTWKQVVEEVMLRCISEPKYEKRLRAACGNVSGKKRVLLSETADNMRSPLEIGKNLYMETHYDTETLLNILVSRILSPIGYNYAEIEVTIRNK